MKRRIVAVIVEQWKLYLVVAGAVESHLIKCVGIGADVFRVTEALQVLKLCRLEGEQLPHLGLIGWIGIFPVGVQELRPEGSQAFIVGVSILRDDDLNAFRMTGGQPKANRGPVVLNVDGVFSDSLLVEEFVNAIGKVVERVGEVLGARGVTVAVPGSS